MEASGNRRFLKVTGGIVATILLGAIGSGVWASLLGPGIHRLGLALLTVISLGLKSFKDGIYQAIAAQGSAAPAFNTFALLNGITTGAVLAGILFFVKAAWADFRRKKGPKDATEVKNWKNPFSRRMIWFYFGYMIFFAAWEAGSYQRTDYIGRAALNFQQVIRIDSPYLTEQQTLQYESRFAQIRTREDYAAILSQLYGIAQQHGQFVPRFDIW